MHKSIVKSWVRLRNPLTAVWIRRRWLRLLSRNVLAVKTEWKRVPE